MGNMGEDYINNKNKYQRTTKLVNCFAATCADIEHSYNGKKIFKRTNQLPCGDCFNKIMEAYEVLLYHWHC